VKTAVSVGLADQITRRLIGTVRPFSQDIPQLDDHVSEWHPRLVRDAASEGAGTRQSAIISVPLRLTVERDVHALTRIIHTSDVWGLEAAVREKGRDRDRRRVHRPLTPVFCRSR